MATREQAERSTAPGRGERRTLEVARRWKAGETGCAGLIVGLKREIHRIRAGELLQVTALDASAAADIPAWCRMTGHTLVAEDHPTYVVRKKND